MSELTTCNYCNLQLIRQNAKKEGKRVVLRPSSFMSGTNVYVLPKDVKMPKGIIEPCKEFPNGDEFHEKYCKSWFMHIPNQCVC